MTWFKPPGGAGGGYTHVFEDGFEDGDLSEWSAPTSYSASTTRPKNGSYSLEYDGSGGSDMAKRSFTGQQSPQVETWLYVTNLSSSGARPQFGIATGGTWTARVTLDDGTIVGSQGEVIYYDGTWNTTGIVCGGDAWFRLVMEAIDYTNGQYDIAAYDNTDSVVGTFTGATFGSSVSQIDEDRFLSDGFAYYADDVAVQTE